MPSAWQLRACELAAKIFKGFALISFGYICGANRSDAARAQHAYLHLYLKTYLWALAANWLLVSFCIWQILGLTLCFAFWVLGFWL